MVKLTSDSNNTHFYNTQEGEGWSVQEEHSSTNINGRCYKITACRTKTYSPLVRFARGVLGCLLSLFTVGMGFAAKLIQKHENPLSLKIHQLFASKKVEMCLTESPSRVQLALAGCHAETGASYDAGNRQAICDLVYRNPQLGFACVVDGTGHNNPNMREALEAHFDPFIESYAQVIGSATTYDEALNCFKEQVIDIETRFKDRTSPVNQIRVSPDEKKAGAAHHADPTSGTFLDPTYKPAMSLVQLVKTQDHLHLFIAQAGDTMVVVQKEDGTWISAQKSNHYGVGDDVTPIAVKILDITGAKRVVGFSDGIGEFMTWDELTSVLSSTESPQLFEKLRAQAMSDRDPPLEKGSTAANGAGIKKYDSTNPKLVDDMGLFVLDIATA